MLRTVSIALLLAAAVAGGLWYTGHLSSTTAATASDDKATAEDTAPEPVGNIGDPLYQAPVPAIPQPQPRKAAFDPVVIPDCQLAASEKEEVASQRDGIILVIGTDVTREEWEKLPADRKVPPVTIAGEERYYRRLKDDDEVKAGQLVAMIDDRVARDEWKIKLGKLAVAEADVIAAKATQEEAEAQRDVAIKLHSQSQRSMSTEELRTKQLAAVKYRYEHEGKKKQVEQARNEVNQAWTVVGQHEVRSAIDGFIKTIYKNPGEALKSSPSYEAVMQIVNVKKLRAEGQVEEQSLPYLQKGMSVVVERALAQGPALTLHGHLQEVTGVAVTKESEPRVVSCSLDGTVRVWTRAQGEQRILRDPKSSTPYRAVACTPPAAKQNLCLVGGADGQGRIWDLDSATNEPRLLKEKHRGAITCVAFSPDGAYCATGDDVREIYVWDTATGDLKYRLRGHSGAVTSVQFTPQSRLVSAGRDNHIRLWALGTDGGRQETNHKIERRSGDVTQIGVSPDGKHVLFDPWQSKALRVLSLPDGRNEAVLKATGSSQFSTLALFAPDGQTILTAGPADGRLQLWRTPFATGRGYVVRQLESEERTQPNCAAFAPDSSFVVAGTRDRHVLVWAMPTKAEIEQQRTARLAKVDRSIDPSSRQVVVWADLENSEGLIPGNTVTLVRYPDAK